MIRTARTWAAVGTLYIIAIVLTLLYGCAIAVEDPGETSSTDSDRRAVQAALDTWSEHSLPYSQRCVAERKRLTVLAVPRAQLEMGRALSDAQRGVVNGCYISYGTTIWVPDDADVFLRQDIVVHESLHWLHECNWGTTDHMHTGLVPMSRAGLDVCVWERQGLHCMEPLAWARL